jgi:hypothetical protein
LYNHEKDPTQPGNKYTTAETRDKEIILLTWNFSHDMWINRNNTEHDHDGNPSKRTKQKIINHIIGITNTRGPQPYTMEELALDKLETIPLPNLKSILITIKSKQRKEKKKGQKNRKKLRQLNNKKK